MLEESLRESAGYYDVEKVGAGKECLEALRGKKFDILLLDHALPDGAGLEWLKRFNKGGGRDPDDICHRERGCPPGFGGHERRGL